MSKKKVSWKSFHQSCITLADIMVKNRFKPHFIYGIPRGGLIPATIISHYLDIPLISTIDNYSKNILVVDEICESGKTIETIKITIRNFEMRNIRFGTIYVNEAHCKHYPNYFVHKTTDWVVFPYEQDKDTISLIQYKQ